MSRVNLLRRQKSIVYNIGNLLRKHKRYYLISLPCYVHGDRENKDKNARILVKYEGNQNIAPEIKLCDVH